MYMCIYIQTCFACLHFLQTHMFASLPELALPGDLLAVPRRWAQTDFGQARSDTTLVSAAGGSIAVVSSPSHSAMTLRIGSSKVAR